MNFIVRNAEKADRTGGGFFADLRGVIVPVESASVPGNAGGGRKAA